MAVVLGLLSVPQSAQAGRYDIDLARLADAEDVTRATDFRSLSSELGSIMALQPVDTADSLGLSGFSISADVTLNSLNHERRFWRGPTAGGARNIAPSLQLVARKGLFPGLEVGVGTTHLFESTMWSIGGYFKASLHEGFHHLPIPSIAIRGTFGHVFGAKDLSLTTAAVAVTISHVFGVGKTLNLTPYIGYEALFVLSHSSNIDATPYCDELEDTYNEGCPDSATENGGEFAFDNLGVIVRHRPHLGVRMVFSVMRLAIEGMFIPGGSTSGSLSGQTVADNSSFQQQYTFSVGLDF